MTQNASSKPGIFAIRNVSSLTSETHEGGHELKRAVSATQLTAMGVGAIIGTGIFVVIGEGAGIAGPAVILSFVLAAVACVFSALSYAELASIPVWCAYTYSYATLARSCLDHRLGITSSTRFGGGGRGRLGSELQVSSTRPSGTNPEAISASPRTVVSYLPGASSDADTFAAPWAARESAQAI